VTLETRLTVNTEELEEQILSIAHELGSVALQLALARGAGTPPPMPLAPILDQDSQDNVQREGRAPQDPLYAAALACSTNAEFINGRPDRLGVPIQYMNQLHRALSEGRDPINSAKEA
jgi:hypothetical protein